MIIQLFYVVLQLNAALTRRAMGNGDWGSRFSVDTWQRLRRFYNLF